MATDPRRLGMFPLSVVMFPHTGIPLLVFEPRYLELLSDCLEGGREFGVVLISRGSEVGGGDHRTDVGTVVRIAQVTPRGDQRFALVAEGVRRLRVVEWLEDDPYPQALIEELPPDAEAPDGVLAGAEASVRRLRSLLSELGRVPALPHDIDFGATTDEQAWRLCASAPLNAMDSQELLATDDPVARVRLLRDRCDALAADVTAMLADGGTESGGPA
jgi:Lon protease-like protein